MLSNRKRVQVVDLDGEHVRFVSGAEAQHSVDFGEADEVEGDSRTIRLRYTASGRGALTARDSMRGAGLYGRCTEAQRQRIAGARQEISGTVTNRYVSSSWQ